MKVVIRDKVYDADKEPIMIIFSSDKERLSVIKDLSDMAAKEGERGYVMYPDNSETDMKDFEKHLNVRKTVSNKL